MQVDGTLKSVGECECNGKVILCSHKEQFPTQLGYGLVFWFFSLPYDVLYGLVVTVDEDPFTFPFGSPAATIANNNSVWKE